VTETDALMIETREHLALARLAAQVPAMRGIRDLQGAALPKGVGTPKTIRELREERGESQQRR
jgi:hypothetical protein